MVYFDSCNCPVCQGELSVNRLSCSECGSEFPVNRPLSVYDTLNEEQKLFLEEFLRSRGNIKTVGEQLNISYPTVKKKLDDLLSALGYAEESEEVKEVNLDMRLFGSIKNNSSLASEIVRAKLFKNGGIAEIRLLDGKPCKIVSSENGKTFTSDKLNNYKIPIEYKVFDCVIDLLRTSKQYTAPKGNAHGKEDKVGYGKCTDDTIVGTIAINYFGKSQGESTLDPTFVISAILEWAGIAHNKRGFVTLSAQYISRI